MKTFSTIHKLFPFALVILVGVLLIFFLHFFQNLNEAVLSNQLRIYRLNTTYYQGRIAAERGTDSTAADVWDQKLHKNLDQVLDHPFFSQLRRIDGDLDRTLETLEEELLLLMEEARKADKEEIEDNLQKLQHYVRLHTDRQLFTLRMFNNVNALSLLLLMSVLLHLFYRNHQKQKELEKALEEKDFLIKEVHHRVKNNLAMVQSFISLQSDRFENRAVLQNLESQIRAILTIHKKLYQDDDVTQIHLRRYVHEIVTEIFYSLSYEPVEVNIDIDEEVYMSPGKSVLIGLILSEFATNAVKHGFNDSARSFVVQLEEVGSEYELRVANSGNRFPDDVELNTSSSLGLVLVQNLVSQLKGRYHLEREPQTEFVITFPKAP